jgi:hypothetical protein
MFKLRNIAVLAQTAALTAATLAAASAAQAETERGKFRITNDAHRVVECNLMVEGHTRTYLKVHMGKAYFDTFPANHLLQLACVRGAKDYYGPMKIGVDYRFVDAPGDRIDVIEAPKG